ncbi:hypothetical protein KEM56_004083 [Ascosphaera pollenicola]|nr:hypothetical protein KEM56_004083 [Ascosphaera pollenicola]
MAPPRRTATAAAVDDAKTDAAVTTSTTKSGTASRSRKNASSAAKAAAAESNAASGGASGAHQQPQQQQKQQQHHQIYLSQGIGLQSPTAIAARRAQQAELRRKSELGNHHNTRRLSSTNGHDPQGLKREKEFSNGSGIRPRNSQPSNIPAYRIHRTLSPGASQSHLAQGRVSKEHLASNVRRHFNSSGLVEQDAIARFLYKVREERRGKEFRIKFSP